MYQTALLAKVCVGIYVVLSGFGLAESVKKKGLELASFYKRRVFETLYELLVDRTFYSFRSAFGLWAEP